MLTASSSTCRGAGVSASPKTSGLPLPPRLIVTVSGKAMLTEPLWPARTVACAGAGVSVEVSKPAPGRFACVVASLICLSFPWEPVAAPLSLVAGGGIDEGIDERTAAGTGEAAAAATDSPG